ncbi:MAG: hypothetical protein OEN22_02085 [Gammaproteobacteria bacterium]|nr:hypothetical protein [Gammaproteobacteria bacterium]
MTASRRPGTEIPMAFFYVSRNLPDFRSYRGAPYMNYINGHFNIG